ncbi:MAG: beta-lactamase family protein [Phycisphaeraceae bacterium]|nr:MAG: beta-lactamase family protein [Phycisphaeraceae bacterium]
MIMLRPRTVGLAVVSVFAPALHALGGEGPRDLADLLRPIVEARGVPGLAAAIVKDGEVVGLGAWGVRAAGSEEKVTTDDRWHLGSCTKSMTATMIGTLVEDGVMSWDMTVFGVFPELKDEASTGWETVTLRHLLTNRGGVPGDVAPMLWRTLWKGEGTATDQRMTLVKGMTKEKLKGTPGEGYIYSNAGFSIAGAMAERVTGKGYEALMHERVFGPLGMTSAGFGPPGRGEAGVTQPRGHRAAPGGPVAVGPDETGSDNPDGISPASKAHATMRDWASYAAWHAGAGKGKTGTGPTVSAGVAKAMHTPAEGPGQAYAMGWVVGSRPWAGGTVLMHTGSNSMWFAVCWVAPERGVALVAASNAGGPAGERACDDACAAMLKAFLAPPEREKPAVADPG